MLEGGKHGRDPFRKDPAVLNGLYCMRRQRVKIFFRGGPAPSG